MDSLKLMVRGVLNNPITKSFINSYVPKDYKPIDQRLIPFWRRTKEVLEMEKRDHVRRELKLCFDFFLWVVDQDSYYKAVFVYLSDLGAGDKELKQLRGL